MDHSITVAAVPEDGGQIVTEPGIELANTPEISPDVAGWRLERMPELPVDEPIREGANHGRRGRRSDKQ